jgi:hypothetical protein
MDGSFAVLVMAEWFDWPREQRRAFFGEHRRGLPFSSAVDAYDDGVQPVFFNTPFPCGSHSK